MTDTSTKHWLKVFFEEFKEESDRAYVILAGSMIDQALETLLKARLVPSTSQEDNLFSGAYAPLGSFSAKIDLSYRIGMKSGKLCRDLHLIRKARNEFAHNVTGCNFASSSIRNRIVELTRSSGIVERAPNKRNSLPDGPRGDFQITVSWILWSLWNQVESIIGIKPANEEFGYDYTDKTKEPE